MNGFSHFSPFFCYNVFAQLEFRDDGSTCMAPVEQFAFAEPFHRIVSVTPQLAQRSADARARRYDERLSKRQLAAA